MKVTLLSCTPDALSLLLRTKNTRLKNDDDPAKWSEEKRAEHIAYMRDTIKSSWEFVDYVFNIEGVTRSFTHQLVRTRSGSYAQESQRTVEVDADAIDTPLAVIDDKHASALYGAAARLSMSTYKELIARGVPIQDARDILPNGTKTGIICKFNLRTLSDMAKLRLCTRTQGPYQRVFREMRRLVVEQHPWAAEFIEVHCVATGTCAFPRYGKKECKFYDQRMDLSALQREVAVKFWSESDIQEARPVARDGKTM